jgi:predicted DNA-binding antitoxin AbrB/MazE fold protein
MRQAITAVYENGVFVPSTKIVLPEHTAVKVSIPVLTSRKKKGGSLEALFDIAKGGVETDISINHDAYSSAKGLPIAGTAGALASSSLAGIWKDRDLGNSATFARNIREQAQKRTLS